MARYESGGPSGGPSGATVVNPPRVANELNMRLRLLLPPRVLRLLLPPLEERCYTQYIMSFIEDNPIRTENFNLDSDDARQSQGLNHVIPVKGNPIYPLLPTQVFDGTHTNSERYSRLSRGQISTEKTDTHNAIKHPTRKMKRFLTSRIPPTLPDVLKKCINVLEHLPIAVTMCMDKLEDLSKDLRLKTCWQTGSKGHDYNKTRRVIEKNSLEYKSSAYGDRPIYGALDVSLNVTGLNNTAHYGHGKPMIFIKRGLQPKEMEMLSFTLGDSFSTKSRMDVYKFDELHKLVTKLNQSYATSIQELDDLYNKPYFDQHIANDHCGIISNKDWKSIKSTKTTKDCDLSYLSCLENKIPRYIEVQIKGNNGLDLNFFDELYLQFYKIHQDENEYKDYCKHEEVKRNYINWARSIKDECDSLNIYIVDYVRPFRAHAKNLYNVIPLQLYDRQHQQDETIDVIEWLKKLGLQQYQKAWLMRGCDTFTLISGIIPDDLEGGWLKDHNGQLIQPREKKLLLRAIERLK